MRYLLLITSVLVLVGCGTPYGTSGSLGGVKVWRHPKNKVEIVVSGRHNTNYDELARMWKNKANEVAYVRGTKEYEIVSFSTGREILGIEVIGEGSNIERYADDSAFWLPKIARGVIRFPASPAAR